MRIHSSVHLGPFPVSFVYDSEIFSEHLSQFFSGYECTDTPDFVVHMFPSQESPPPVVQVQKKWIPLLVRGRSFEIGPHLIRGTLELEKKECSIWVHIDVFNLKPFNFFQVFLYHLYHTLCMVNSLNSNFIHGCGVIKDNTGYLFIGPQQSGKTTIGKLSNGLIIHDDQIIITLNEEGLTMDSPPLPARFRHHPNKPCPIEKIFLIVQNNQVSIKQLSPAMALKSLYNEIVLPLTLYSSDGKEERFKKARFCFEILKLVPVLELHFDEQGKFWNLITNMRWS